MTVAPLPELRLSSLARTVDHWLLRGEQSWDIDPTDLFDLAAPYQRASVWTLDQRVALVKSLLMGLPTGAIITSALPSAASGPSYRVVDGKQRIETVRAFAAGEVPIPAWWVRQDDRTVGANGQLTWADLTDRGRRVFSMRPLPELLFQGETEFTGPRGDGKGWHTRRRSADELLIAEAELYGLINGAGTAQTAEDMARAAAVAEGVTP